MALMNRCEVIFLLVRFFAYGESFGDNVSSFVNPTL